MAVRCSYPGIYLNTIETKPVLFDSLFPIFLLAFVVKSGSFSISHKMMLDQYDIYSLFCFCFSVSRYSARGLSCLEYILNSKEELKSSFPFSTSALVAESIGCGRPMDSRKETAVTHTWWVSPNLLQNMGKGDQVKLYLLSVHSRSCLFLSHLSSSLMMSMMRGKHSRAACALRKANRVRRAKISTAVCAYS